MKFEHLGVYLAVTVFSCSNTKTETQLELKVAESQVAASGVVNPKEATSSNVTPLSSSILVTRDMLDKVEVSVPGTFKIMDAGMIALKYPLKQRSEFQVYTNKEATVNIAFEHLTNKATLQDLPAIKQFFELQFNQPEIDFRKSEIRKINGRDFIVLELITPAIDTKVYNLMFVTSSEGRLLMGTFNCTMDKQKDWEPIAERILRLVKIIE